MLHVLPHQAVIKNVTETTKLRIVFDAATKIRNELLFNDSLLPGPCLLRFRIGKYVSVADIN